MCVVGAELEILNFKNAEFQIDELLCDILIYFYGQNEKKI